MSKTITDLQNEFTVKNGLIQNPGKFENEPLSTPFYYDLMLNGEGEFIDIEPSDRVQFPNIPDDKTIAYVTEDDQGFVTIEFLNAEEEESIFDDDVEGESSFDKDQDEEEDLTTDNQYFTYKNGIIKVKINADMNNRTLSEINTITDMLNDILHPINCQAVLKDNQLCFYDGMGYYPIDEHFDTTIY